jgi:hypothetical protein
LFDNYCLLNFPARPLGVNHGTILSLEFSDYILYKTTNYILMEAGYRRPGVRIGQVGALFQAMASISAILGRKGLTVAPPMECGRFYACIGTWFGKNAHYEFCRLTYRDAR